jgi:hypothetical protein
MTTKTMTLFGTALLCAIAAGCSSGAAPGDAGAPRDTGAALGGGILTWKEGGTMHTAQFATGTMARSASLDLLEVTGADVAVGLSFGVAVMPPPLVAGPYACGGSGYPIVSFSYTGTDGQMLTCALDVTSLGTVAGAHTVGTFSASLSVAGGATKAITDGRFDVVMTISTL